jgi:hypothetical protein
MQKQQKSLSFTKEELDYLASLLESEKARLIYEDPDVVKPKSALHSDYSLSEKISTKLGRDYVFSN